MKNTYYLIFVLCLSIAQTKPMISYGSANTGEDYYNLNNMPEDILKEIALQESGKFSLEDLKKAKYFEECLKFNQNIKCSEYGTENINRMKQYQNIIKKLYLVNKKLRATLHDLIIQFNETPKKDVLLYLNYFDSFFIYLPKLNNNQNDNACTVHGSILYDKGITGINFCIEGQFCYYFNEYETLALPKAIESLNHNYSLKNAYHVLETLYKEGFHKSEPTLHIYINALSYFNKTSAKTRGCSGYTFNGLKMCSRFTLFAEPSQTNKANEPVIPYLLIKSLLTDAE